MPRQDDDLLEQNFPESGGGRSSARFISVFAVVLVVVFIVAVGYFYLTSGKTPDVENLPLISESNTPQVTRPADPGGMEIPHQDAGVYDRLDPKNVAAEPEKLLPAPETPMPAEQVNAAPAPETPAPPVAAAEPEHLDATLPPTTTIPPTAAASIPSALPGLPSTAEPQSTAKIAEEKEWVEKKEVLEKKESPSDQAVPAAQKGFRIQLGAVRDEAAANTEWARLQKKHGEALSGLDSSFLPVNLGSKGTFLRIQAGPLSREDADARCAKLKTQNQACLIVKAAQ